MSPEDVSSGRLYGLLAEFDSPSELVAATRRARREGYQEIDAYAPFPIEELADAVGHHRSRLPLLVLLGGLAGFAAGLGLEYFVSAVSYPLNIGGKPYASWPAFIPPAFETTILFAAIAAVLGMFALCGLPMPYHPVFNAPRFSFASQDRYFLCIEARDSRFDRTTTRHFLESLSPTEVTEVDY